MIGITSRSRMMRKEGRIRGRTITYNRFFASSAASAPSYDIVIVGGGAVGSSIAYHIATMIPQASVCVIERDPTYKYASTPLSAGGIRQQFSLKENIQMSLYGIDFIKKASELLKVGGKEEGPNLQFQEHGYLFLASSRGEATLRRNHATQREAGIDWMDLLGPAELQQRFPWINPSGQIQGEEGEGGGGEQVVLGSFGRKNEGWFDPWSLLQALKRKAQSMGVDYIHGEVCGMTRKENRVTEVLVRRKQINSSNYIGSSSSGSSSSSSNNSGSNNNSSSSSNCSYSISPSIHISDSLINAAGAFAAQIIDLCNTKVDKKVFPLPIRARRRQVFSIHCPSPQAPPPSTPLVIDPSGVYFRPEGRQGRYICGVSPEEHEDPDHDSVEALERTEEKAHQLFDEVIWPTLYHRVPAFEELKVTGVWQGFYDYNTVDQNAIIGAHPDLDNVYLANGFSGHGLQHAPATGRAIAELLKGSFLPLSKTTNKDVISKGRGRYKSIDLTRLGLERLIADQPLYEENIV